MNQYYTEKQNMWESIASWMKNIGAGEYKVYSHTIEGHPIINLVWNKKNRRRVITLIGF